MANGLVYFGDKTRTVAYGSREDWKLRHALLANPDLEFSWKECHHRHSDGRCATAGWRGPPARDAIVDARVPPVSRRSQAPEDSIREWIDMSGIGLLNEKPLHAALKQWYARPGDRFEVIVAGFVVDIVRDDLLIEIQTGNFAAIKSKLNCLVHSRQVRLIYPIVQEKWIIRSSGDGLGRVVRRKSPKRGRWEDLFWELVSIPQLLLNGNFSLEVLMIKEEEARRDGGKRRWRRKGWVIETRRLLEVLDRRVFKESADWRGFLPEGLESFTTSDLATAMNTRRSLAQKMAYCLQKGRVIELIGRRGRANLYRVPSTGPAAPE
jgi:hypothetical protein